MKNYILVAWTLLLIPQLLAAQKFQWNNNKVIAHRGAWKAKNLPENSIAALKEAMRLGVYGAEFDVHLTADNVVVVNHDHTLQGLNIETSTYAQLLEKSLSNGEKIPTLEAYLKEGKKQRSMKLILEMKPSNVNKARSIELSDACYAMVKKMKMQPWVEYISFDYDILKNIRGHDTKAVTQYLNGTVSPEQLKADKISGADYHYSVFKKDESWFKKAKELGLVLNAWTVNTEADMRWLLNNQIDFITTNEPELLFEVLKK